MKERNSMKRTEMISLLVRRIGEQKATNQHASAELNAARLLGILGVAEIIDPSRTGLKVEAVMAHEIWDDEGPARPAPFNPDESRA